MQISDFLIESSDEHGPLQSKAAELIERMAPANFNTLMSELKKVSGRTVMGVGNGGGNLFINGEYDAIKVVQNLIIELGLLRKMDQTGMKQPIVINIDDIGSSPMGKPADVENLLLRILKGVVNA